MGIPRHTRIILIPEETGNSVEYGISRGMVITLLVLAAVFCGLLALLMITVNNKQDEMATIRSLESRLNDATREVAQARALRRELDDMRALQERLLVMLGVDDAGPAQADSLTAWLQAPPASAAEGLHRAATVVLKNKPDRWPARGFVTKEFTKGNRSRGIRPHLGIDIAGPKDGPVIAAGTGTVVRVGQDPYLGNFVEIQHGLGYLTVYGHCSRIAVKRGDKVESGQLIAYVGQSGQASAPHLHFEILHQGEAVNPRDVLAGDPPQH